MTGRPRGRGATRRLVRAGAVAVGIAVLAACTRQHPAREPSAEPFTLAVLPDTQYATAAGPLPGGDRTAFEVQTRWLAANAARLGLAFVLHEGDLVDAACATEEWEHAAAALAHLTDAGIPWAVSAGNHDVRLYSTGPRPCTDGDPVDDASFFDRYVPLAEVARQPTFGGAYGEDARNTFHTLRAGGVDLLVLALEFGPRVEVLAWALDVVRAHPEHHAILLTHDLVGADGELRGGASTSVSALPKSPRLTGAEVWDRLVRPAGTIELTLNGHVVEGTAGRSVAPNDAGLPVHRLLANYQTLDGGTTGYLRLLTVHPGTGRVEVRTYSPVLDRYLTDDAHEFTLTGMRLAGA